MRWNALVLPPPSPDFSRTHRRGFHRARTEGRTAVFFGLQNCSPIEDDIGLVEICHALGVRFMQLSYNNQSLPRFGLL